MPAAASIRTAAGREVEMLKWLIFLLGTDNGSCVDPDG
jgi:hypothetical protein